jgi:hypothetical protein
MNAPAPAPETTDGKLNAVVTLVQLFRVERFVYLGVTGVALLMLLTAVGKLLLDGERDVVVLTSLFGSSGLLTFALGQVLRMYNQAIEFVAGVQPGGTP